MAAWAVAGADVASVAGYVSNNLSAAAAAVTGQRKQHLLGGQCRLQGEGPGAHRQAPQRSKGAAAP
jgi:hypothetical protein